MLSGLRVVKKSVKASDDAVDEKIQENGDRREAWMTDPTLLSTRQRLQQQEKEQQPKPKPIHDARDGDKADTRYRFNDLSREESEQRKRVGDGGASWRKRLERRKRERQHEEKETMSSSASYNAERHSKPMRYTDETSRKPSWRRDRTAQSHDSERSKFLYGQASSSSSKTPVVPKETHVRANMGPSNAQTEAVDVNKLASMALKARMKGDMKTHDELQARIAQNGRGIGDGKGRGREVVDVNKLASMALKAKMKGDMQTYEDLQKQITESKDHGERGTENRVEVLSALDREGRAVAMMSSSSRRPNVDMALQEMVQRERLETTQEYALESAMAMARDKHFVDGNTDDQFDNATESMFSHDESRGSKKKRQTAEQLQEMDRQRVVSQHKRQKKVLDRCWHCFGGPSMRSDLVIATGLRVYLTLPRDISLSSGHCLIVPMEHSSGCTALDEDVFEEVEYFKKHLVRMFASQQRGCVFLETSRKRGQRHCVVECIPVEQEEYEDAPMYFKKAILECEDEWSTNKKLIDTKAKGLRKSVPVDFPYFHVNVGVDSASYAHVIEDESRFPNHFGHEVLCGIIGEPPELLLRKRKERSDVLHERVKSFKEKWKRFDWTRRLLKNQ